MRKVIRIKIYAKELRNVYSLNDFRFFSFLLQFISEMLIITVFYSVFFMVILFIFIHFPYE